MMDPKAPPNTSQPHQSPSTGASATLPVSYSRRSSTPNIPSPTLCAPNPSPSPTSTPLDARLEKLEDDVKEVSALQESLAIMAKVLFAVFIGLFHCVGKVVRFIMRCRAAWNANNIEEFHAAMQRTDTKIGFGTRVGLALGLIG